MVNAISETIAMMRALNRITYDLSSEIIGILVGLSVGILSAMYLRLFRSS